MRERATLKTGRLEALFNYLGLFTFNVPCSSVTNGSCSKCRVIELQRCFREIIHREISAFFTLAASRYSNLHCQCQLCVVHVDVGSNRSLAV